MGTPILFLASISLVLLYSIPPSISSSTPLYSLRKGSSLSVEKSDDVLVSPKGIFTAGFYSVGDNAYCFAIWFSEPLDNGNHHTIVWMANRDQPVNGRLSKLSLLKNGNLILTDADQLNVWSTNTNSLSSSPQLRLLDTGNLVLSSPSEGVILWQSFDSPTDTLLPLQPLTRNTKLVSSRSQTNYSSGFYKLFFEYDNLLHLLYDSPEVSSVYWPPPWLNSWEGGRSSYNNSRIAMFNLSGHFESTDDLKFRASDFGIGIQRRLTMDFDGNVRMYSLDESRRTWNVSWQAFSQPCKIHGACGHNSICTYVPQSHDKSGSSRTCSCIPGYKVKNRKDWSQGCEPVFSLSCNNFSGDQVSFLQLINVEFYGYDIKFYSNYTLEMCKNECLKHCNCYGFQFKYDFSVGYYNCYPKTLLVNGYRSAAFGHSMYIRLPKTSLPSSYKKGTTIDEKYRQDCSNPDILLLNTTYKKPQQNVKLQVMVWFASGLGGVEIICVIIVWCFLYRSTNRNLGGNTTQGFLQVATGFRKFKYDELKKASNNFCEEIGRGGFGVVYKGVLSDDRVVAIKRLNEANQAGEAEFLAEVSTIGKLNHMNLIEMLGYCAEGKHRLLVYEYMEHGSLAESLSSNTLDSEKRFDIAVGTAKGLAYLHEECLEWVLHCDVKPQNILLDSDYQPKVADFGLSKLLNRGGDKNSSFSRVRGTRGYMAPEWILNLPITSKVDVYSYGVVVLEMITGKKPMTGFQGVENAGETEQRGLIKWVREKISGNAGKGLGFEEIIDPTMKDQYDESKMEILVGVALQCVEEDIDARPTMSQVIKMLVQHEDEN